MRSIIAIGFALLLALTSVSAQTTPFNQGPPQLEMLQSDHYENLDWGSGYYDGYVDCAVDPYFENQQEVQSLDDTTKDGDVFGGSDIASCFDEVEG